MLHFTCSPSSNAYAYNTLALIPVKWVTKHRFHNSRGPNWMHMSHGSLVLHANELESDPIPLKIQQTYKTHVAYKDCTYQFCVFAKTGPLSTRPVKAGINQRRKRWAKPLPFGTMWVHRWPSKFSFLFLLLFSPTVSETVLIFNQKFQVFQINFRYLI